MTEQYDTIRGMHRREQEALASVAKLEQLLETSSLDNPLTSKKSAISLAITGDPVKQSNTDEINVESHFATVVLPSLQVNRQVQTSDSKDGQFGSARFEVLESGRLKREAEQLLKAILETELEIESGDLTLPAAVNKAQLKFDQFSKTVDSIISRLADYSCSNSVKAGKTCEIAHALYVFSGSQ